MKINLLNYFIFNFYYLIFFQSLFIYSIGYIQSDISCNTKMSIDQSLLKFHTDNNLYSLYGVNHICYKCSKILIANENNQCAMVFTPHSYRLYILYNMTDIITKRDYLFGEHGVYIITFNHNSQEITIDEEKSPIDSMKPLIDLFIVIIIFTFFIFLPTLIVICSLRCCKEQFNEFKQITIVDQDSISAFMLKTFINEGFLDDDIKQIEKEPLIEDSQLTPKTVKKSPRLQSLDTFRGFALFMMIFVNYGGIFYFLFSLFYFVLFKI